MNSGLDDITNRIISLFIQKISQPFGTTVHDQANKLALEKKLTGLASGLATCSTYMASLRAASKAPSTVISGTTVKSSFSKYG